MPDFIFSRDQVSLMLAQINAEVGAPFIDSTRVAGFERGFMPTGGLLQNMSRADAISNLALLTTGTLMLVGGFRLPGNLTITNISFVSATTAANLPTHQLFGLYLQGGAKTLLATTADGTTTAWAAHTVNTMALTAPYTPSAPTDVYVACMVTATAMPTLAGSASTQGMIAIPPIMQGNTGDTGLTTALPATYGTLTAGTAGLPYVFLS